MDRGKGGPRKFEETAKGQKTLQESSKGKFSTYLFLQLENKAKEPRTKEGKQESPVTSGDEQDIPDETENPGSNACFQYLPSVSGGEDTEGLTPEQIQANLEKLRKRQQGKGKKQAPIKSPTPR